jgi:uncharacterized protein (TIGR02145 family)
LASLLNNLINGGSGNELKDRYPVGTVFCAAGPSEIVDVINPNTGKTWMDRNLGASRSAISSTDSNSFGDLYQWGRFSDGHQCRDSKTRIEQSITDKTGHGDFLLVPPGIFPFDWRNPANPLLWQGVNGTNNPCPIGYRIPTAAEMNSELQSWNTKNSNGAFSSPLKWTLAGSRGEREGEFRPNNGIYWVSTVRVPNDSALPLFFNSNSAGVSTGDNRALGFSVRCIKD